MTVDTEELERRIQAQKERLEKRPEPECEKSPTGKHDASMNKYSRANGKVCGYCFKLVS